MLWPQTSPLGTLPALTFPSHFHSLHAGVPVQEAPGRGQARGSPEGSSGGAAGDVELLWHLVLRTQDQGELVHGVRALLREQRDGVGARAAALLEALWGAVHCKGKENLGLTSFLPALTKTERQTHKGVGEAEARCSATGRNSTL